MDEFKVKHEQFEGPMDLLLSLIEKRKLFINEISLSKVTDDFIEYVRQFESETVANVHLDRIAHFILVASTLLLIKSRSLLPTLDLTVDEKGSIEDLENRLKIYSRIKELSEHIKSMFGKRIIFGKSNSRSVDPVFAPDASMTVPSISEAMQRLIDNLPKLKEKLPEVMVRKVVSLEEMIDRLSQRISAGLRMTFGEFSAEHKAEKVNIIVSFLAMLELVKNGALRVEQSDNFSDIHMETDAVGTPRYL